MTIGLSTALQTAVDARLRAFERDGVGRRLWDHDAGLWKDDTAHGAVIEAALGWLSVVDDVRDSISDLLAFSAEVAAEGYRDVVLLGMGGSSLAPEVVHLAFGSAEGYPKLTVLDSTDPRAIAAVEERLDFSKTLFVVASKSGGTVETASLHAYFHGVLQRTLGEGETGRHFVAITDEDTELHRQAVEQGFRAVFVNPADIGGRYSALSFFGLVPAALTGVDLAELLGRAQSMVDECGSSVPPFENPGLRLGAALGELALAGREKLTIVASPPVGNFGAWIEQLIAESTGKEGTGILPVDAEPLGAPESYGHDRAFAYLRLDDGGDVAQDQALAALEAAGFPVLRLRMSDAYDMGAQFFLWEVAVAAAGSVMGINPFDQPNVQESKDNTRRVLAELEQHGEAPLPLGPSGEPVAFALEDRGLEHALRELLDRLEPPAYLALQAWVTPSQDAWMVLQEARVLLRSARRVAVTAGFGPRFLHSTGQYHKGGPPHGRFLQLVSEGYEDRDIPGSPYGFARLKHAQALGDLQALLGRPAAHVLRIDIGPQAMVGLIRFRELLRALLAPE